MSTVVNPFGSLHNQRIVFKGNLSLKRCHVTWRPRYAELVSVPNDLEGLSFSFQLLLFEAKKQCLKSRIMLDDVVTLCSSMDCHFQLYLVGSKILQLRTDTTEKQAQWMAMIKVGLGKGTIFHVQVYASEIFQHALLYSIQINLPAHRIGQLDRVLVLASPVNDICINAWDFNHIQRFLQMDIGIKMELCKACLHVAQNKSITFVMDKRFIKNCTEFLCRESNINSNPVNQNGFTVYNVPHSCLQIADKPAPSIYSECEEPIASSLPDHAYDLVAHEECSTTSNDEMDSRGRELQETNLDKPYFQRDNSSAVRLPAPAMVQSPSLIITKTTASPCKVLVPSSSPTHSHNPVMSPSSSPSSCGESSFQVDEIITSVSGARSSADVICTTNTKATHASSTDIPPRNITREKHATSIPASSSSAMSHGNLQTQLLQSTTGPLNSPYQGSSHTKERSPLGNKPWENGRFHLLKSVPLPPRGLRARSGMQEELDPAHMIQSKSAPPNRRVERNQGDCSTRSHYLTKHDSGALATSINGNLQEFTMHKSDMHHSTYPQGSVPLHCVPLRYTPTSNQSVSSQQRSCTWDSSMDLTRSQSSNDLKKCLAQIRVRSPTEASQMFKSSMSRTVSDNSLDQSFKDSGPSNQPRLHFTSPSPGFCTEGSDLEDTEFFQEVQKLNIVDPGHMIQKDHKMSPGKLRSEHAKIAKQVGGVGLGLRGRRGEEGDWLDISHREFSFASGRRVTLPNALEDSGYTNTDSRSSYRHQHDIACMGNQRISGARRITISNVLEEIDNKIYLQLLDDNCYKHSISFPPDKPSSFELPDRPRKSREPMKLDLAVNSWSSFSKAASDSSWHYGNSIDSGVLDMEHIHNFSTATNDLPRNTKPVRSPSPRLQSTDSSSVNDFGPGL